MILTVCQRGSVRSVTAAQILKDFYGYDNVMAVGVDTFTPDALRILWDMASIIYVVADKSVMDKAPANNSKIIWLDIGEDHWLFPLHPGLMSRLLDEFEALALPHVKNIFGSRAVYEQAHRASFDRMIARVA